MSRPSLYIRHPLTGTVLSLALIALYWDWRFALAIGLCGATLRYVPGMPRAVKAAALVTVILACYAGPAFHKRLSDVQQAWHWLQEPASTPHHFAPGRSDIPLLLDLIARETTSEDAIQVFGDQVNIYWLANRRPASRFFWLNAAFIDRAGVTRPAAVERFQQEGMVTFGEEFLRNTPRVVIVSTNPYETNKPADHIFRSPAIQQEIARHYDHVDGFEGFQVFLRRPQPAASSL